MITILTKIHHGSVWDHMTDYTGAKLPGKYSILFDISDAPLEYQHEVQASRETYGHPPTKFAVATSTRPIKLTEINHRYDEFERLLHIADLRNMDRMSVLRNRPVTLLCEMISPPPFGRNSRKKLTVSEIIFDVDSLFND